MYSYYYFNGVIFEVNENKKENYWFEVYIFIFCKIV